MVGLGTLVNSGAILAGAGAGLLLRRGLPEKCSLRKQDKVLDQLSFLL